MRQRRRENYGDINVDGSVEQDTQLHKGEISMKTLLSRDSGSKHEQDQRSAESPKRKRFPAHKTPDQRRPNHFWQYRAESTQNKSSQEFDMDENARSAIEFVSRLCGQNHQESRQIAY